MGNLHLTLMLSSIILSLSVLNYLPFTTGAFASHKNISVEVDNDIDEPYGQGDDVVISGSIDEVDPDEDHVTIKIKRPSSSGTTWIVEKTLFADLDDDGKFDDSYAISSTAIDGAYTVEVDYNNEKEYTYFIVDEDDDTIAVETDGTLYSGGNEVTVSGQVDDLVSGEEDVQITIIDPNNDKILDSQAVTLGQGSQVDDDEFKYVFDLDSNADHGRYAVIVNYDNGDQVGFTLFEVEDFLEDKVLCYNKVATIVGTEGDDEIVGTDGNDVIAGLGGNDMISGEDGHDVICGGSGDDEIHGGNAADLLIGDYLIVPEGDSVTGGNDLIYGDGGNDFIYGDFLTGEGNNMMIGGDDIIYGGSDQDSIIGDLIVLSKGSGNNNIVGGNDQLYGEAGGNSITGDYIYVQYGSTSHNIIQGGDDLIIGGDLADALYGDSIFGKDGIDEITGGDDSISGLGGKDKINGDYIIGGGRSDIITGGNDAISGGAGDDTILGDYLGAEPGYKDQVKFGNDVINGNGGDDLLLGDDSITATIKSGGNDRLFGGDGNDKLKCFGGKDSANGGDGTDTASANCETTKNVP
jgi:Ca2+-binding RTX toxin-like protein